MVQKDHPGYGPQERVNRSIADILLKLYCMNEFNYIPCTSFDKNKIQKMNEFKFLKYRQILKTYHGTLIRTSMDFTEYKKHKRYTYEQDRKLIIDFFVDNCQAGN